METCFSGFSLIPMAPFKTRLIWKCYTISFVPPTCSELYAIKSITKSYMLDHEFCYILEIFADGDPLQSNSIQYASVLFELPLNIGSVETINF